MEAGRTTRRTAQARAQLARDALDAGRRAIDTALHRVLARRLPALDARLAAPIQYAIEAGGKRLRPVLCLSAYRAAGGGQASAAELIEAASALELIHTYSLLHDDLPCMDDDDYRRGRPTAHRIYGETATTLAAAAMIPLAAAVLDEGAAKLGLTPPARTAAGLESIHSHKTGALFGASLRIGARLARADEPVVGAFGRCGVALGLAFQVADDILDVTGRTETLGKSAGRDAEHGKATYPGLLGVEGARRRAASAAADAVSALRDAGIHDDVLEGLIEFAVSRDR
jgi:farnesyl diphosphate synthase/geranylgeranyl diphosphate synthase type II